MNEVLNAMDATIGSLVGPLGWALVHSLWQGALVALVYAAARSTIPAERSASRYRLATAGLILLVALPLATMARLATAPAVEDAVVLAGKGLALPVAAPFVEGATSIPGPSAAPAFALPAGLARGVEPLLPWITTLWLVGVAALSLLHLAGLRGAHRLRIQGTTPAPEAWVRTVERLARRLEVRRAVVLLQSTVAKVPSVVGWLRPAIVVPASAFVGLHPAQLEALLAHELAHVRRGDYLVNLLQTVVETLFFYHPATWWISGEMRREREHCCDDLAVDACGDRRVYARALAGIAELRLRATSLALGADGGTGSGSVLARVRRLFTERPDGAGDPRCAEIRPAEVWIAGLLALALATAGIGAGTALLGARQAQAEPGVAPPVEAVEPALAAEDLDAGEHTWRGRLDGDRVWLEIRVDQGRHGRTQSSFDVERSALDGDLAGTFSLRRDAGVFTFAGGFDGDRGRGGFTFTGSPGYVERMASLGWRVPRDQLFQAALFDLRVDWATELASLGYGSDQLDWDELIAFRIHDVTPDFAREMAGLAGGAPSADQLLAFRIHDVSAETVRELEAAGLGPLDADQALAFQIHGVSPEAIAELEKLGLGRVDADQALAARIHGVDAGEIEEMRAAGIEIDDLDQAVAFRIHGVTPDFVRELRDEGVRGLDADSLVALRVHDVDVETVRDLRSRGFDDLDADDLVDYAIHGRRWARAESRKR